MLIPGAEKDCFQHDLCNQRRKNLNRLSRPKVGTRGDIPGDIRPFGNLDLGTVVMCRTGAVSF
jgi:hypothetical protein